MQPIWINYEEWEDYQNGMYEKHERMDKIKLAKEILKSKELFTLMWNVTDKCKNSTLVHLTQEVINPKAWLGQACCNLASRCTVVETSKAWTMLTSEERNEANEIASIVIKEWRENYIENLRG